MEHHASTYSVLTTRSTHFLMKEIKLHDQINGNRASTYSVVIHTIDPLGEVKRSKIFFY